MILAIETSDVLCSVAFWEEGRTVIEYNLEIPMQHAAYIGRLVNDGLNFISEKAELQNGAKPEIDLVCAAIGPGSFTGLRIGLSFAKGFCFGRNIPITGITNHQVLAVQAAKRPGKLFTIIEARRNEVYLSENEFTAEGFPLSKGHQIVRKENLAEIIGPGSQIVAAANLTLEKNILEKFVTNNIVYSANRPYAANLLAKLGSQKVELFGEDSLNEIEPLYIRPFAGVL